MLFALFLTAMPDAFAVPKDLVVNTDTLSETTFDELEVKGAKRHGRAWRAYFAFVPEGAQQPATKVWSAWKPLLEAKGWKVVAQNGTSYALQKKELWATVQLGDYDAPLVHVLQEGGAPTVLTIGRDVPPFPGTTPSGESTVAFIVPSASGDGAFIADASRLRTFAAPKSLSRHEAITSYDAAFKKAGWVIDYASTIDGVLYAHDPKRNVWAAIGHRADGTEQSFTIATVDRSSDDWGKLLDAECKLTLRGVVFDFDKATLKKESDAVLSRAADVLKTRARAIEVQGHTDNVGDDAYNQKLSEQRAQAVRTWLVAHGVPGDRVSAAGYGKRQPIADNDSDAGRAKNRRVELRCKQ